MPFLGSNLGGSHVAREMCYLPTTTSNAPTPSSIAEEAGTRHFSVVSSGDHTPLGHRCPAPIADRLASRGGGIFGGLPAVLAPPSTLYLRPIECSLLEYAKALAAPTAVALALAGVHLALVSEL